MRRLMCYSKKYILEEPLPSKAYFYTMFVILDPSNHFDSRIPASHRKWKLSQASGQQRFFLISSRKERCYFSRVELTEMSRWSWQAAFKFGSCPFVQICRRLSRLVNVHWITLISVKINFLSKSSGWCRYIGRPLRGRDLHLGKPLCKMRMNISRLISFLLSSFHRFLAFKTFCTSLGLKVGQVKVFERICD